MIQPITRDVYFNSPTAKMAGKFILQAVWDYGAARCALLNGMFSGFILAQQAIEKLMKAYIYASSKELPIKRYKHGMAQLASEVSARFPELDLGKHEWIYLRLENYYNEKYPDVPVTMTDGRSTREFMAVDELAVSLFVFIPFEEDFKRSLGIFPIFYHHDALMQPAYRWIRAHNMALDRFEVMVIRKQSWPEYVKKHYLANPQEGEPSRRQTTANKTPPASGATS